MSNTHSTEDGEGQESRFQDGTDRRKGDRRQSKDPYTGPERRKHKRREH